MPWPDLLFTTLIACLFVGSMGVVWAMWGYHPECCPEPVEGPVLSEAEGPGVGVDSEHDSENTESP